MSTPLAAAFDGALAVQVFFVLSGFVLASAGSRSGHSIFGTLAGRVVRLSLPIAASVGFAYVLFLLLPREITGLRQSLDNPWLETIYNPPNLAPMYALASAFGGAYVGMRDLNPVVWTMRIELIGSFAVYVLYHFCPKHLRIFVAAIAIVTLAVVSESYVGFFVGASLFEVWSRGYLRPSKVGPAMLSLGLCASMEPVRDLLGETRAWLFGASLIVFGTLQMSEASILASRVGRHLGRISFGLYLSHFPLLFSAVAFVYLQFELRAVSLAASAVAAVSACWGSAYLAARLVDEPAVVLAREVKRLTSAFHAVLRDGVLSAVRQKRQPNGSSSAIPGARKD
jgi:peptidoglycan/LPS O-acetylase OafA/YrhL